MASTAFSTSSGLGFLSMGPLVRFAMAPFRRARVKMEAARRREIRGAGGRIAPVVEPSGGRPPRLQSTSGVERANPLQGAQAGHEAVFAAARDDETWQALKAAADWPAWDGEVPGAFVRAGDGVFLGAGSDELAIVDPD